LVEVALLKSEMKTISKIQITLAMILVASSAVAQAKDVSAQQAGVEYARQEFEKADVTHKANLKDVADSERLLAQRKKAYEEQIKQLLNDRKKAELSKQHLQEANAKYSKAQAILDQAWKE
jgi:hypothetical protein